MTDRFSPGTRAAALTLLVGLACVIFAPLAPWLVKWPAALTLPATEWIGAVVTWLADALKPLARMGARGLSWPMGWAGWVLIQTPFPLTIGAVTALGWHLGGWRMAAGVLAGLGFVLISGYWAPGMTTLSLVAVTPPASSASGTETATSESVVMPGAQ